MIRISNSKLIIEIDCTSEKPLEKLSNLKAGLLNFYGIIDHDEAPKSEVRDGLRSLTDLLKEMSINEIQSVELNQAIIDNSELKRVF